MWVNWKIATTRESITLHDVSRKHTHIILGMSAPLITLHPCKGCLSSKASQSSAEK